MGKQTKQTKDSSASTEKKEPSRKPLFENLNLNQDLKHALNSWDTISETGNTKVTNKRSPGEEQLQEMKKLLGELKSKLNEFSK